MKRESKITISKLKWLRMAKEAHWFRHRKEEKSETFRFQSKFHGSLGIKTAKKDTNYNLVNGVLKFKADGTEVFGIKEQIKYDIPESFSSLEEANAFLEKLSPRFKADTGITLQRADEIIGSAPEEESGSYTLINGILYDVNGDDVFSISELGKYNVPVFKNPKEANLFLSNLEMETGRPFGRVEDVEFKIDYQEMRGRDTRKNRDIEKMKEYDERSKRWRRGEF